MSTARRLHHTYADYLTAERDVGAKLEFSAGEIYALPGGTPEHAALAMKVAVLVGAHLPSGCRGYSSDAKIRIEAVDLATHPDLSFVCGPIVPARDDPNAITNPRYLVEVTSPSTEDYDRGEKLRSYQQLPSVEAVLILSHARREVTVVRRQAGGWVTQASRTGEPVALGDGLSFSVDEVYSVTDIA